jgi:outer membrane protein TolC
MRRFIPLLCLPVLIPAAGLAAPVAEVPPPNLPPEAVVVAALDNHPTVAAAGQRVSAARAAATALGRGSHEVLVTGTIQARDVTNERRYAEFDTQVLRPIRLPGKAALDREAGVLGVDVAHNRMEDSRHQAALLLSQLWFDWLTAGELHRVDLANAAVLDEALAAVTRRQQLRDAAALDVDQARAARDQAQGTAAMSAADMAQARALLAANFPDLPLPDQPPALGEVPTRPTTCLRCVTW